MTLSCNNIILIGPMGVGKTTLGKHLAKRLNLNFFDTDTEVINSTGVSINQIFEIEGEAGFRVRETKTLIKILAKNNVIIATGGGIIARDENRELLKGAGLVVYLKSNVAELVKRVKDSKNRPIINKSSNIEDTIKKLIEERDPYYKEIANLEININEYGNYKNIVDEIIRYAEN